MLKIIIAGTRTFNNYERVKSEVDEYISNLENVEEITIISGGAQGADHLGERYAKEKGFNLEIYPADWEKHGKKAGYIRNEEMAKIGNLLFAFWDHQSKGTEHMINLANKYNLEVHVKDTRGKIWLSNINGIKVLPKDCIKLFVARQPIANMDKYNLHHEITLAPSGDLLSDMKGKKITWQEYVVRYRREMVQNNMQPKLDKILKFLTSGKDIALICYCGSPKECHRGILGNYFKEMGFDIIFN